MDRRVVNPPERVADGVWLVRAMRPASFVALYILQGTRLAVVDTGFNHHPAEALAPALAALDLDLADVDVILNTHAHPDHLGGNAALKEVSGAAVHLHQADLPMAGGPEAFMHSPDDFIAVMRGLGWQNQVQEREDFLRLNVGPEAGVDRVLAGGDLIDLGDGLELRVVQTPGHTPGSVTYLWEAAGLAFSGDAVQGWGGRPGVLPLYFDAAAYAASLQRLAALDIQTLCLGHPFRWSAPSPDFSPVRRGVEVERTLADSQTFVDRLDLEAAAARSFASPLAEQVLHVLANLDPPFEVPIGPDGRFPAISGAAIIAHLRAVAP